MKKILIAYWTQTGATEKMAKATEEGARAAGAEVTLRRVNELGVHDMLFYDAYIFGTGNYFQTMAGMVWDYFDKFYYEWLKMDDARNKVYATLCSAGVGGAMCLNSLNTMLRDLKWKRVFDPVVAMHMPSDEVLEQCRLLGKKMAELKPEDAVDLNPPRKPRFEWPPKFKVIAWSGVGVEVARSWTPLLSQATKMKMTIAPESNTVNRFKWLGLGLFHLTAGGTSETSQMIMADRKYAARDTGPFPIRVVWAQSKSASGMFVRGDSSIKTVYDIKPGTRVADMLGYAASARIVEAYLAWGKVRKEDVVWTPAANYRESVMSVVEGKCDVCFGIPTSPALFEAEKNPRGIRWLEYDPEKDPEGYRRFIDHDPLITFGKIPTGVPSSIGVSSNVGVSLYLGNAATHPMMIHRLCRWFDDNYDKYRDLHAWNQFMNRETLMEELEHTFIPCHEGLIRCLREKELWSVAHEERQKKNLELLDRYIRAYDDARDLADGKGMAISPDNPEWVDFWEDYKKQLGIPPVKLFRNLAEN